MLPRGLGTCSVPPPHHALSSLIGQKLQASTCHLLRAAFLDHPPIPTPTPTHGEFSQLGVLALLRCQHLLGWDCVAQKGRRTQRAPHQYRNQLWPRLLCRLGPLRGCLAAQETNPGQHPRVGLERTWRIVQPSCQPGGFGGTSGHQQPGRAMPWQGSAPPLVGNGGLHIRDKLPTALCQPWPLQPRAPSVVTRHTL